MHRYEGKRVLVVGGGMGMGRAIAESFAGEGATVVISEITKEAGEDATSAIAAQGGKAYLAQANISKRDEVKAMIAEAARLAGGIDILVQTAASANHGKIVEMSDEAYDELVRCNIHSIFWMAKDAAPYLSKAKDKGRLIYISSAAANRVFYPGGVPYSSSKAYMNAFARGLAVEFGPLNILVNTVEPGMTRTTRNKAMLSDATVNAMAANYPIQRVGQSQDIANAVLFLASSEASYITGTSLLVDGGSSMVPLGNLEDSLIKK